LAIQIDQVIKELTVSGYPSGWIKMLFKMIDLLSSQPSFQWILPGAEHCNYPVCQKHFLIDTR